MKIRGRLILSIGLLAGLFIAMALLSVIATVNILAWERDIYEVRLISINRLIEADRDAYQSHLQTVYLLWAASATELDSQTAAGMISDIESNAAQVEERYSVFRALMTDVDSETRTLIDAFDSNYSRWMAVIRSIVSNYRSGNLQQALASFSEDYNPVFDTLRSGLDLLTQYSLDAAAANHTNVVRAGTAVLSAAVALAIVGIVISFIVSLMMVSRVLKPIADVNVNVRSLSAGTGDLSVRLPVKGRDEMAELSDNINRFMEKTEAILIELRASTRTAEEIKDGLVSSVEENSAAATEISANVDSISVQVERQNRGIQSMQENMERMKESVRVLEEQVSEQAAMVEESTASITQMIASIQSLSGIAQQRRNATEMLRKKVDEGSHMVAESNDSVQAIHADIDAILEMTKLISGISSQTNLLSMNAAIEAAHAGDAGRGFSVVAQEIRKLAETSADQSRSINEVLSRVVKNIEKASNSSGYTSQIYGEILNEFSTLANAFREISDNALEMNTGGAQILEAINHLSEHSQAVRSEAGSLHRGNEEMATVMNDIAEGSQSVSSAVAEINTGMREVAGSLEMMRNLAGSLAGAMSDSHRQLSMFKLSENLLAEAD